MGSVALRIDHSPDRSGSLERKALPLAVGKAAEFGDAIGFGPRANHAAILEGSNRSATAVTSDGYTKKNTPLGSMKRWMSQEQAMRPTLGRALPTPCATTTLFPHSLSPNS
jgi:hypothetical protein